MQTLLNGQQSIKQKLLLKILFGFFATIGLFLGVGFVLLVWIFGQGENRTDTELYQHFHKIKTELNVLNSELLVYKNNGLERIDRDWSEPHSLNDIGISEETLKELRKKLDSLSLPRGVVMYGDTTNIRYLSYTFGIVTGGTTQGYLYSQYPPQNQYKYDESELQHEAYRYGDKIIYPKKGSYTIYTFIESKWYFFNEYDD